MGPPSFNGGRGTSARNSSGTMPGFNGASVFQRRKALGGRSESCTRSCFNGASVFQRRKGLGGVLAAPPRLSLQWGLRLSTEEGPTRHTLFQHGCAGFNGASVFQWRKDVNTTQTLAWLILLQWGLRLSTEEGLGFPKRLCWPNTLQWGLRLSTEEGPGEAVETIYLEELQWGLRLSTEEGFVNPAIFRLTGPASMGPPSFNGGRGFPGGIRTPQAARFNGASVFQRRKVRDDHGAVRAHFSFNGASVFQRRKGFFQASPGSCTRTLQWGLRLSTEEGVLA